jgi:hypothetical protein
MTTNDHELRIPVSLEINFELRFEYAVSLKIYPGYCRLLLPLQLLQLLLLTANRKYLLLPADCGLATGYW